MKHNGGDPALSAPISDIIQYEAAQRHPIREAYSRCLVNGPGSASEAISPLIGCQLQIRVDITAGAQPGPTSPDFRLIRRSHII